MVNLQEVLDPLDVFRKVTRLRLQDLYNLMLKKGWTLGTPQTVLTPDTLRNLYGTAVDFHVHNRSRN